MPWGFAIAAAGAIGGAAITAGASNKATNTQTSEFNQTTANNKPFLDTGTAALTQLGSLYGLNPGQSGTPSGNDQNASFYQSPDYQFTLGQGIKGIDAGAAAGGMLDSGATRKAEAEYAGNLASTQFNNYATRLQGLAGIGQSAANNQATQNTNYANNISNLAGAQGQTDTNLLTSLAGQAQYAIGKNPFGSSYSNPTVSTSGQASGPSMGWT